MTKFQKWLIVINAAILVVVLVRLIFFRPKEEWTPPPLVDNTEEIKHELDSIKSIQLNIDSLKNVIIEKDAIITKKNTSIIKLKEKYEKDKRSVTLLPADESIEFFTKFIETER